MLPPSRWWKECWIWTPHVRLFAWMVSVLYSAPLLNAWLSHVTWFDQWDVSKCGMWHSRGFEQCFTVGLALLQWPQEHTSASLLGYYMERSHIFPLPRWGHHERHKSLLRVASQPTADQVHEQASPGWAGWPADSEAIISSYFKLLCFGVFCSRALLWQLISHTLLYIPAHGLKANGPVSY